MSIDADAYVGRGLWWTSIWGRADAIARFAELDPDRRRGKRLSTLLDAPSILISPALWKWVTGVLSDPSNPQLEADLARFEISAAILTGGSADRILPAAPLTLPGTGRFLPSATAERCVSVRQGMLKCESKMLTRIGSLLVDPYEPLFEPTEAIDVTQEIDALSCLREQLREALTLADSLVPGLSTRFASVVVPISASSGWHSATDETCSGVVYLSPAESALGLLEGLVHEEAHVLLNAAEEHLGLGLPHCDATVEVPWREDRRPLEAAVHGVAAFSRVEQVRRRAEIPNFETTGWGDVAQALADQPEVDDELKAWLSSIDVDEPAPVPRSESDRAVAIGTAGRWAVFDQFHDSHVATLLNVAETAGWNRRATAWFEQWSFELTNKELTKAVESELKRLLATVTDEQLRATSHRLLLLKPGDRIERHTDADSGDAFRSVVMLTPGWNYGDGGELEIAVGTPPGAGISIAPESGTVAVFETAPDLWHEVRPVVRRPRLSLATSWEPT